MKKIEYNEDGTIIVDGQKYVPQTEVVEIYYQKSRSIVRYKDHCIKILLTFKVKDNDYSIRELNKTKRLLERYLNVLMLDNFDYKPNHPDTQS